MKWPLSDPNTNPPQRSSLLEQSHSGRGSQEEGCAFVFSGRDGFHGLDHAGVHRTPGVGVVLAKLGL